MCVGIFAHIYNDYCWIRKNLKCMLKLKLQYFGHLMQSWLIGKDSDAGRNWGQEEKGMTEDETAGWHHLLDGCEFEWTPGVGDEQGSLSCCNSWGRRVGQDCATELNWTELNWQIFQVVEKPGSCLFLPLNTFELSTLISLCPWNTGSESQPSLSVEFSRQEYLSW